MMRVRLSGEVSATVDGDAVELGPAKSRAVLAALALQAGAAVPVARIIELVWGVESPRTAEKTLQTYIARLRKACGPDTIARTGNTYRLMVEPADVDLVLFDQLLDAGDSLAALELWRGEPLAGLGSTGLDATKARLSERFLSATERLLAARITEASTDGVISQLRDLTAQHPLREGLWSLLMRALYRSGRQAEALRAFADARTQLVDGLGIEPGPELQQLERQILDQDATLAAGTSSQTADQPVSTDQTQGHRSFLFTEIVDSTALWAQNQEAMTQALAEHDRIVADTVKAQGGETFKHTGDGIGASFPNAGAALQAAVESQLALQQLNVDGEPVMIQMAISTGTARSRDGDWFGPALNVAARLLDAGHGGQILLSGASHDQLDNNVDANVTTTSLGLVTLKGLSRPEQVHQVLHPALPRRFPPLRSVIIQSLDDQPDFPPQLRYDHGVEFVGRADQLKTINTAWQRARSNSRPEFVLLAGEPGVGKTRLAAAASQAFHENHDATVIYGRCPEDHRAPFRPFTEALTAYANARSDVELRTEIGTYPDLLAPVLPLLTDRFADIDALGPGADVAQLEIFDAVTSFLEIAASSPLVIVLDDIHWADQSTLDVLLHLVRNMSRGRLLVLATYRDVEVDRSHPLSRALAEMRREANVERLAIRGIDGDETIALTEAILGHELSATGREMAARAGGEAAGNPFFLQEMLRHFMESGVLVREKGRWTPADPDSVVESVPEGVREVVGRRLDRVSSDCNLLLRTASAFFDDIDIDLLVALLDIDEDTALDLLDEALQAGLLIDGTRIDRYEFSHALVRQTLYREFSTARRLRLHRKIADTLAAQPQPDDAAVLMIAHHYLAGATVSDPAAVAQWASVAADLAVERYAFEEAAELLERARDTTEGELAPDAEVTLLGHLASQQRRLLRYDLATATVEQFVRVAAHASHDAVAHAVLKYSRSVYSLRISGPEGANQLQTLLGLVDATRLDGDLQLGVIVERAFARIDQPDPGVLIDRLNEMDLQTLERALTGILARGILSRAQQLAFEKAIEALIPDTAGHSLRTAAQYAIELIAMSMWRPIKIDIDIGVRPRSLHEFYRSGVPMALAMRRGQVDYEAPQHKPLTALFSVLRTYRDRWAAYESDKFEPGEVALPREMDAFDRSFNAGVLGLPHMRAGEVSPDDIRRAADAPTDRHAFPAVAYLAWESGMADLAEPLTARFIPGTGLALPPFALSYITAIDSCLGLLAELEGRIDDAIELQSAALEQTRPTGFVIDHGYIAWFLVRLLGRRNTAGDTDLAREIAADALTALEPSPFARRKRMLNEALEALP